MTLEPPAHTPAGTGAQQALCEKCGNEPGLPYTFLFGTHTVQSSNEGAVTRTLTTEEVKGEETAHIGDRCIEERRHRTIRTSLAVAAVSMVVFIAALLYVLVSFSGWDQELSLLQLGAAMALVASAVVALIGVIFALSTRGDDKGNLGELVAIEAHEADLRRRGFEDTWTHRVWKNKTHMARS